MDVIALHATAEQLVELGTRIQQDVASTSQARSAWVLACVYLQDRDQAETARKARAALGQGALLVGIGVAAKPEILVEAGLDDMVEDADEFARRQTFFESRLRQRVRRHLRLEAILENTVDGILVIDERGVVQSVNKAVTEIFGYAPDELLGRNVSVLMPSPDRDRHDQYLSRYLRTGERRIIGIGREVTGLRKNGTEFPLDLAVSEARLDGRSVFAGVVRDISERRRLENEILRAGDEERRRIGHDLHDGLGQMLTGIGLIARNIARSLEQQNAPAADDVREIATLIQEADQQARALAQGLVPVELDRNGLWAALVRLCGQAERLFGGHCVLSGSESVSLPDSATALNLYRIAQEAVSNAFKHGRSDLVEISITESKTGILLSVRDNGVGFHESSSSQGGMGVRIMHYRASVLGGTLHIEALPESGTLVTCLIPSGENIEA